MTGHLCIIPARGGSKRIPRKNIRDFLGKPVMAYSIEAALSSGLYDEVMVSTDDSEMAETALRFGASVPFLRSEKTANDFATTAEVIAEVLDAYASRGREFTRVTCLYSTAPFVTPERLREANSRLDQGYDSAFSVVQYSYPPQRALRRGNDGRVEMIQPEFATARSQDLEPIFHDAGQFYVSTVAAFRSIGSLWGPNTAGIPLSELEVQDLDTPTDWTLAEMKYKLTR